MSDEVRDLLHLTADLAADFHESLPDERRVVPRATAGELRAALGGPLPERADRLRARGRASWPRRSTRASWRRRAAASSGS